MSIESMDLIYEIEDDSMAPRLNKGDTVVLKSENDFCDGDIGVFLIGGKGTVCRALYKNGNEFILKPLNEKCKIISIPVAIWKKVCKIIGKVVSTLKKLV